MTALLGGNTINGGLVRLSNDLELIGRKGGSLRLGPEGFLSIRVKVLGRKKRLKRGGSNYLRLEDNKGRMGRMWRLRATGRRFGLVRWNGRRRCRWGEMYCRAERPRKWGRCGWKRQGDLRSRGW